MEYTIREMRKSDWSDVLEIYYQGIQTNMATFETQCPSYEEWDRVHCQVCRYVIETDGDVVGWTPLEGKVAPRAVQVIVKAGLPARLDERVRAQDEAGFSKWG